MSSAYPPFGGAPAQLCQRCGMALPPNEVYCTNCGYSNTPAQGTPPGTGSLASNIQWGGGAPQAQMDQNQQGASSWNSPSSSLSQGNAQPNYFGGAQFGSPAQPMGDGNAWPSAQSAGPSPSGSSLFKSPTPMVGGANAWPSAQTNSADNYASPTQSVGSSGSWSPSAPATGNLGTTPYASPTQAMGGGSWSPSPLPGADYQQGGPAQPQGFYGGAPAMPGGAGGFQSDAAPPPGLSQPPAQRRLPDMKIIIGVVVLLVVLIGGGIGYMLLSSRNNNAATTSSSSTAMSPTAQPKGTPIFADSFKNNSSGWNLQGDPGKFSVAVGNGALTLEDKNNRLLWELVPGGKSLKDFNLTVDATLAQGDQNNGYGIYIRGSSSQTSELATYYRFELYGDGSYAIFKGAADPKGNSTATKLVDYTFSSAIQKQGSVNHISIVAKGPSMSFVVNGETLKTITDSSYVGGSVAFFVSNLQNAKPGAQAKFSNLAIYPPQ
ncbi:hypothetical protein EPA93_44700 [Ktedonosporobacter rubrisoli]|uniref:3-keto-alpha-glucoside-1,2-lyase/3-keto-2-hydroxy-glucal hydratase domain-containing protein n=1 Tax=Ktedonosporobacter rubrisoli TaxID=2509675 RepID=A0A4P6K3H6_KTERU|nr:family 16 glycoside hydrolase [Ktedonosporobacter rubrisoli]QBD82694.1 hypothetical protein EPA93_44700 [Ktedonosporobacter rubrisoli]